MIAGFAQTLSMKKTFSSFLFIIITITLLAQGVVVIKSDVIEQRNGKSYYIHNVQKGQTVYSISRAYNVTPDEIYFENPGSKNGINVNQILYIPTINKETELSNDIKKTSFDFFYHVAAENERFSDVASIYIIPEKYIRKANPDISEPLREGEYIKVPVEDAFDILDGKTPSNDVAETNIPIYKPTVNPSGNRNNNNKPVDEVDKPRQSNKTVGDKNVIKEPEIVDIEDGEFVSFDPNIPIIPDYRHVVILGETTQSIADKYNIPVKLLKAANPGLGNTVVKGDRLRVPDKSKLENYNQITKVPETKTPQPQVENKPVEQKDDSKTADKSTTDEVETIDHKVISKETLYSIGRKYGLTVDELIKANPGLTPQINIGQIIKIPKKKISKPYIIHTTQTRIKTKKLARLYQIPEYQIYEFNPGLGKRIDEGTEVKIPVGRYAIIVPIEPEDNIDYQKIEEKTADVPLLIDNECAGTPHTDRLFKIALMIPFELQEADSLDKEQFMITNQTFFKPFRFIQFYEGALLAIDSMVNQGMNIQVLVYDVDKQLAKTAKVLKDPELKTVDMIIGPFYTNSFNQVALFAGNFNIPVVNPLTYRDEVVTDYKSVIKVNPTIRSQEPLITNYIHDFERESKVFLISQTSYLDADIVTSLKNNIINTIPDKIKVSNSELIKLSYDVAMRDTLYTTDSTPPPFVFENMEVYPEILLETTTFDSTTILNNLIKINYSIDSLHPFLENASPIRNNFVVLYGTQKSFILDVLNKLNETRDTFNVSLLGIPTWERISNLSNIKMNNLKLSYFSSSYTDYNDENIQDFVYTFRNSFGTEPERYAFTGFDVTYYFLSAMFQLGDSFYDCLEQYPMELTRGTLNFRKVSNGNNFINDYWHLLQLRNMELRKVPDVLLYTPDTE